MKTAAPRSPLRVEVILEEPLWRGEGTGLVRDLRRAVQAAFRSAASTRECDGGTVTVLLAGDRRLEALNAAFRNRRKATNVLAFPSGDGNYLGDIAIAYGTAAREARVAGKPLREHAIHLAVHGILHLLGYDHERADDARRMEPMEVAILNELGIADPYAPDSGPERGRRT